MFDLVIRNGTIVDGTGNPGFRGDVAINGGKIAAIGKGLEGREMIDASGLTVTPGFIDSHSHADKATLAYPDLREKVEQGITCAVSGQCGSSPFPISRQIKREDVPETYDRRVTPAAFLSAVRDMPLGCSQTYSVGHGALRAAVLDRQDRKPTEAEMAKMKDLLREAMENGALGLSFGLFYSPGCYAETAEVLELAKVVAEYDGVVSAHMRDEGDRLIQAAEEYVSVIREAGVRGVISHHKAGSGKRNWGKVHQTLRMVDEAVESGVNLYLDVYPYIASSTSLNSAFLPGDFRAKRSAERVAILRDPAGRAELKDRISERWGSDFSWVKLNTCPGNEDVNGLFVPEAAKKQGKEVYDFLFDLYLAAEPDSVRGNFFTMNENDMMTVMAHPRAMICTDSGVVGKGGFYHPRLRGSFPRAIGVYVREKKVTTLPDMIRKMTSLPAQVYRLPGKGILRPGFDADLCVFNFDTIRDTGDFDHIERRPTGLNYVLVGGKVVAKDSVYTGERRGKSILFR